MSRGLGTTQHAILDILAGVPFALTVVQLADQLGRSPAQIRRAVHALAERDLVTLTKAHAGHAGEGRYGPLMARRDGVDLPTAETRKEPDYVYFADDPDHPERLAISWRDVEYVHRGMPTGLSLLVSLPDQDSDLTDCSLR